MRAVEEVLSDSKETRIDRPELPEIPKNEIQSFLDSISEKTLALGTTFPDGCTLVSGKASAARARFAGRRNGMNCSRRMVLK